MSRRDRLVMVQWLDTLTDHGWADRDVAATTKAHHATSVGWLIQQDDTQITIAQTISEAQGNAKHQVNGTVTIPRAWLVGRIITLKVPTTEPKPRPKLAGVKT